MQFPPWGCFGTLRLRLLRRARRDRNPPTAGAEDWNIKEGRCTHSRLPFARANPAQRDARGPLCSAYDANVGSLTSFSVSQTLRIRTGLRLNLPRLVETRAPPPVRILPEASWLSSYFLLGAIRGSRRLNIISWEKNGALCCYVLRMLEFKNAPSSRRFKPECAF